jgi:hypothetical protein
MTGMSHETAPLINHSNTLGQRTACPRSRRSLIAIRALISDEVVDLYLERTDLPFRVGALTVSNLVAVRLGRSPRITVASPDYLSQHGTPRSVTELDGHNCLGFNFRRSVSSWPVEGGGRAMDRIVTGNYLANSGEAVRHMAFRGAGLARIGLSTRSTTSRPEGWCASLRTRRAASSRRFSLFTPAARRWRLGYAPSSTSWCRACARA